MSKKYNGFRHRNLFMKISVFDELGKKIYFKDGTPKECMRDAMFNFKFGLQILDWDEILKSLDILNLSPEFERVRLKRRIEKMKQEEGAPNVS